MKMKKIFQYPVGVIFGTFALLSAYNGINHSIESLLYKQGIRQTVYAKEKRLTKKAIDDIDYFIWQVTEQTGEPNYIAFDIALAGILGISSLCILKHKKKDFEPVRRNMQVTTKRCKVVQTDDLEDLVRKLG